MILQTDLFSEILLAQLLESGPVLSETVVIERFIRKMCGGSQPILAKASDGSTYVVKFTNNPQGPNVLFNEIAGNELYQACDLPVPAWGPVLVTDSFLDRYPACWIDSDEGELRPEAGLCFGSRFLGEAGDPFTEILRGTDFARVRHQARFWLAWLIDICARHANRRETIFRRRADRRFDAVFVDHGHLFGGPDGNAEPYPFVSRYFDSRIYEDLSLTDLLEIQRRTRALDVDLLWDRLQDLPDEWKTKSALISFSECAHRISNLGQVQSILHAMAKGHQQSDGHAFSSRQSKWQPLARCSARCTPGIADSVF